MAVDKNEMQLIKEYARELRMPVFRDETENVLKEAALQNWSMMATIAHLLRMEVERRSENGRLERIKRAGFPQLKYMGELVREELPKDAQVALPEIETLDFIKQGRNIVLYGNPGTGKTHTATALGINACNMGYNVLFTSVPHLLTMIRECQETLTLRLLEKRFANYDLVICDEFGYVSCDKAGAEMLFNMLSLRAGIKATIITTNLAFNRWEEIIPDKVLVAAMIDRLTHKAYLINMTGESYRAKETKKMIEND